MRGTGEETCVVLGEGGGGECGAGGRGGEWHIRRTQGRGIKGHAVSPVDKVAPLSATQRAHRVKDTSPSLPSTCSSFPLP